MMAVVQKPKIPWAISLFLVLYFSTLPVQAQYGGGTGEPNDPYLIYTAEQMNAIGTEPNDWDKHFKLMADIDLSEFTGTSFNIVGDLDKPFTGVFDGNSHTISHFNYTSTNRDCIGLFGCVNDPNAEIRDLGLIDPNVEAGTGYCVSSLVGCLANGIISNCYVEGGSVSSNKYVGGLIGGNLPVCPASPEDFADEWLNDDPDTRGMTRLIIGLENSVMNVHGYGKCHPTDCDWGTITVPYTGNPFVAVYEHGFVTDTLTISLITSDSLYVHSDGEFHDGTNRDSEADYFMHRAAEPPVYPDGLAVKKYGNSTIAMCYSTASVSGIDQVGGLMGNNYGTVSDSYSTSNIFGNNDVGGLVGYNYSQITSCYTKCSVQGYKYIGGLAGNNASGEINNSYAISSVRGNDRVGGLAGAVDFGTVTNCYAASDVLANENVGGLSGHNYGGERSTTFWDVETSGQHTSAGGIGKTTAEMQTASTFLYAGWDFADETENGTEDIWWILEGQDYPRLWWELPEGLRLRPLPIPLPLPAFSPDPRDGATDVTQSPILHWAPAEPTLQHDIYFGKDKEEVANATTLSLGIYRGRQPGELTTYEPGKLEWDATYYWRIDEVNEADPNNLWKGSVWGFTTANFLIVDDFESYYNVYEAADRNSNSIFNAWIAVLETTTIEVEICGSPLPSFAVDGGIAQWPPTQVMRYKYDNSGPVYYSEATANITNLAIGQDWTQDGVGVLSLWFHGYTNNAPEPMYVAVANARGPTAVVYHDNPDAATINRPREWTIDLQLFTDQGVDLTDVDTFSIGFGDRNNPQAGGWGTMSFDDIRLYRSP